MMFMKVVDRLMGRVMVDAARKQLDQPKVNIRKLPKKVINCVLYDLSSNCT